MTTNIRNHNKYTSQEITFSALKWNFLNYSTVGSHVKVDILNCFSCRSLRVWKSCNKNAKNAIWKGEAIFFINLFRLASHLRFPYNSFIKQVTVASVMLWVKEFVVDIVLFLHFSFSSTTYVALMNQKELFKFADFQLSCL